MKLRFAAALFLFVLLVQLPAAGQSPQWFQLTNGLPGTTRGDDIYFINQSTGWLARATDGIYKTTNGGNFWTKVTTGSSNFVTHFRSVSFATATHGWGGNLGAGSYDSTVTDTNNILYETFDGGTSWQTVPAINSSGMKGFCAFNVLDSQHIYGGGRVRGPAYFVKSSDQGTNWTIVDLGTNGLGVMGGIMDVYFRDATNGFVVGMNTNSFATGCALTYYGAIARTTNGGAAWEVVATTTNSCCYFWKMSWPSANIGYASLQQNSTMIGHTFYKTVDGGATWTPYVIPFSSIASGMTSFYWQGVGFVSTNEGWAGGDSATSPYANNFIHTTDGGATWSTNGFNDTRRINRIRILDPTLAYASGVKTYVYRIPVSITNQPQSQSVSAGTNATFTVGVAGNPTFVYQWKKNGTNIIGATDATLTLTNVAAGDSASYSVTATNTWDGVASSNAILSVDGTTFPPNITTQPQSQTVNPGSTATFTVTASGTTPLNYQWHFNGTNISGATDTSYTRTNAQSADAGSYSVAVTNVAGSVTSAIATLAIVLPSFSDDFDGYGSPSTITSSATTNGYKIFFGADSGAEDFKAIFGFDYSTVTFPTNIPSAPHSTGGTTKGLFLTANKDATAAAAGVNLYPVGQSVSGNFALKFDLWINWTTLGISTEHALFGINHSGNVTNRVGQTTSDGLFFAVDGDGNAAAGNTSVRDFSVLRGGGDGAIPILMLTNNTTFGPAPLLGAQFDNLDPGFVSLFPSNTIANFTNVNGSAGLRWISGEVRQENNLITWLLNGAAIAQYTNTFGYTNGTVMIGYNDAFGSTIGTANNFAIFDNIRVETISISPVQLLSPQIVGNNFSFSFATETSANYSVQRATDLAAQNWANYTNIIGNGNTTNILVPLLAVATNTAQQYIRVSRP